MENVIMLKEKGEKQQQHPSEGSCSWQLVAQETVDGDKMDDGA